MENNISYHCIPLRVTPAAMETSAAKWLAQPPRRLRSRVVMLFQPWDVWIDNTPRHRQSEVYYARKGNINAFNVTPAASIHKLSANWILGEPSRYGGEPSRPHQPGEVLLRCCGADKLQSEDVATIPVPHLPTTTKHHRHEPTTCDDATTAHNIE